MKINKVTTASLPLIIRVTTASLPLNLRVTTASLPLNLRVTTAPLPLIIKNWLVLFLAFSCSTTKNIPSGELLYTGIQSIEIADMDSIPINDEALDLIDEVLACPPNNAFLGSSYTRTPIPLGLWVYQANVYKKGAFNRWMMKWLSATPVLVSAVKPDKRVALVRNILRDNGYFNGASGFEVIPDKKDEKKAKIKYTIQLNQPYTIDSVEWRRVQNRADTLLVLNESFELANDGLDAVAVGVDWCAHGAG